MDEGVFELAIGPGISLVHDPRVHQGKTHGMDKGLFLKAGERLCAGESAGIGLPVLKSGGLTVFPALKGITALDDRSVEMIFSMEKVLRWYPGGMKAPLFLGLILERIAEGYMRLSSLQQPLLKVRGALFSLLRMHSAMEPADSKGVCTVICRASPNGLHAHVDGTGLGGKGDLILLNEVEGSLFCRLRGEGSPLEGQAVPAWRRVSFAHRLESPMLGLGISLAPGPGHAADDFSFFCGREQGRLLDWAGIALTCTNPVFSYHVRFEETGEGVPGES